MVIWSQKISAKCKILPESKIFGISQSVFMTCLISPDRCSCFAGIPGGDHRQVNANLCLPRRSGEEGRIILSIETQTHAGLLICLFSCPPVRTWWSVGLLQWVANSGRWWHLLQRDMRTPTANVGENLERIERIWGVSGNGTAVWGRSLPFLLGNWNGFGRR